MSVSTQESVENRLLATLPKKEYKRLLPDLERVSLPFGEMLYEPGEVIKHVYFPNNSIISLLTIVENHSTIEVGLVGNEGMAGLSVFMGVATSRNQAVVQGAGTAMKMKAAVLRKESKQLGSLHHSLQRYTHLLLMQISQSAACNRFHTVNARLARWMLMTRDRSESDEFRLTQEFMSNMLGVRREGVTIAASALQKDKLIKYSRGHVRILDRAGLEAASCKCYSIIKQESDGYLD